jgi:predicted thioredoxin/glutaredoxin
MECINFLWPIEQAKSLEELDTLVDKLLKQFEMSYFREIYPDADWGRLGEILEEELDQVPEMPTVAYWLYAAQEMRYKLEGTGK